MTTRLLVVHATDVLARAWLSVPPGPTTRSGLPTNALFGGARTVRRAIALREPDLGVAVLDAAGAGPGWPDDLARQLGPWAGLLAAHGLHVVAYDQAVHLVASLVAAGLRAGCDVVVAGSDKRLGQLVEDRVWWYEGHKDVRYTPEAVFKKFGVAPERVPDWLALVGEDDLVDGVKGIGRKGAIDLVEARGSLARALEDPEAVEGRVGKALRADLAQARANLAAMTLRRDLPLPAPLAALGWTPPSREALNAAYRELELFALLTAEATSTAAARATYGVCADPAAVPAALGALGSGPVAVHALTEDPSPARGELTGIALSPGEGQGIWFPLGPGPIPAPLARWLSDAGTAKIGHDVKVVQTALARRGVEVRGVVGDAILASHLADPSGMAPHDLGKLARAHLRLALPPDTAVRGSGASRVPWSALTADEAGAWACRLADVGGRLWRALGPGADPDLLTEGLALSETLVRMELGGTPCDRGHLDDAGQALEARCGVLEAEVHALAGHPFALGSTKQLGTVLFEELGLPIHHRTKTGWSTSAEALERLIDAHPIVPAVLEWRQLRRTVDTWVTSLGEAISPDGRVHSTFHPARSFTGRLVNTDPDLGRVPGKTDDLARIRLAFRARPGWTMLSVDYQQLGLYVLAHLSGDPALVEPLQAGDDIHAATAAAVLDLPRDRVDARARQVGKVTNFATFAGQGASSLALQLQVSPGEAKRIIERFFERYQGVARFLDGQLAHARAHGWVPLISGRRWRIHDLTSQEPRELSYAERLARRAGPEGSVADVTRRGLVRADRALRAAGLAALPLVQIHDEVLFEVPDGELADTARLAAEAMSSAYPMRVPLRVGCKAGPSWGELEPLAARG